MGQIKPLTEAVGEEFLNKTLNFGVRLGCEKRLTSY